MSIKDWRDLKIFLVIFTILNILVMLVAYWEYQRAKTDVVKCEDMLDTMDTIKEAIGNELQRSTGTN